MPLEIKLQADRVNVKCEYYWSTRDNLVPLEWFRQPRWNGKRVKSQTEGCMNIVVIVRCVFRMFMVEKSTRSC